MNKILTPFQKQISDGCENKNCDFYSTCESDGTTEGRCVCPENCDGEKVSNCTLHSLFSTFVTSSLCLFNAVPLHTIRVYTVNKYNDFHFMPCGGGGLWDAEAYTDSAIVENLVTYKFIETRHLYASRTNSLQMVLYAERMVRHTRTNAIFAKPPARKNNT